MTREEAIAMLKSKMDGSVDTSYEWAEALRIAIEALSAEATGDLISRQWLLDLYETPKDGEGVDWKVPLEVVRQNILDAPSAEGVDVAHDIPEYCSWSQTYTNMVQSAMSSAEAVQGEWKRVETRTYKGECTNCGFRHIFMDGHDSQYRFCPNCGAKMTKGGDSE